MEEAQHAQERLNQAMKKLDDDLQPRRIRPITKKAYLCMAKCTDEPGGQEQLQACLQRCGQPLDQAKAAFTGELQRFQSRIQQCAQSCQNDAQDAVRDRPGIENDPAAMGKVEAKYGKCVASCIDKHISLLPTISKRVDADLKKLL
uniref:Protein FAM136A n=1 Tax=Rhizochromulina marina TaxID=1034831 RepID=A0A7S2S0Y0_9STRA